MPILKIGVENKKLINIFMDKKIVIIAVAVVTVGIGGWIFVSNHQETVPSKQSSVVDKIQTDKPVSTTAQPKAVQKQLESAASFANKVIKYNQSSDFGKMYDLICPVDKTGATKTEYVKAMADGWSNLRIVSFTVKEALEEPNGATVQYVLNTSDGQTQNDLLTLEKNNGAWCFRSNIANLVGEIKAYQNVKLVVNSFDKPYHPPYTTIEAGQEGVRVNVSITNSGNAKLVCHLGDGSVRNCSGWDLILVDSSGTIYESTYLSGAEMPEFQIVPGGTVSGPVGFKVPTGSSGYKLIFRDFGTRLDITETQTGF